MNGLDLLHGVAANALDEIKQYLKPDGYRVAVVIAHPTDREMDIVVTDARDLTVMVEALDARRRVEVELARRAMLAADQQPGVEHVVAYLIADRTRTKRLVVTRRTRWGIWTRPIGCDGPVEFFRPKGHRWVSDASKRLTPESVANLAPLEGSDG